MPTFLQIRHGIAGALRARPGVFAAVGLAVLALELFVPPVLLSIARKPVDYFAFNAWLPELPAFLLRGTATVQRKLEFIPNLALFWFSADSPYGGVEWGFTVTVADLVRFLLFAALLGLYFALVAYCRDRLMTASWSPRLSQGSGASGTLVSILGISSGGCTVMGCGAPVLPVVGLAFAGLSSGALALLAQVSRLATAVVLFAVVSGVCYLAWRAGEPAGTPLSKPHDRG